MQRLVALSWTIPLCGRFSHRAETLRARRREVIWEEIIFPQKARKPGEPEEGGAGATEIRALTLSVWTDRGRAFWPMWIWKPAGWDLKRYCQGERPVLKYIGRPLCMDQPGSKAGQYQNALGAGHPGGAVDTLLHISTCATRCFISDSISGDVFEIFPEGAPARFRAGKIYRRLRVPVPGSLKSTPPTKVKAVMSGSWGCAPLRTAA